MKPLLRQLETGDGNLPQFEDVLALREYTNQLVQCFESSLRGRLLLQLEKRFQRENAWLCLESDLTQRADMNSAYDPRFLESANVCLPAGPHVAVCFGNNVDSAWFGYLRTGSPDGQESIRALVLEEAKKLLDPLNEGDPNWYVFQSWRGEKYRGRYVEERGTSAADGLRKMRSSLIDALCRAGLPSGEGTVGLGVEC